MILCSDAIVKLLLSEGVDIIFGYPGAANAPLYDSLRKSDIKHILTRTEQGAAHAANGYARTAGKVGVCMATSGPGATNLVTGIATAYMDSVPIVAITGQVDSSMIGRDVFQEVDITGACAPFCKHSYLVKDANEIPRIIKEAFYIASSGRPGPVLIDIPIDIQLTKIDFKHCKEIEIRGYKPTYMGNGLQIKKVISAIKKAHRPVICAGGGVISANASQELKEFSKKLNIPVVNTLMGKGIMNCADPLFYGMLGMHGVKAANVAINNADLVLVIGARVGDRAINAAELLMEKATVVHIDIDPAEIGKNMGTDIPVVGHVKAVLNQMLEKINFTLDHRAWIEQLDKLNEEKPAPAAMKRINPKRALRILSGKVEKGTVLTTEVGQNQIWAANYYNIPKDGKFVTSAGLGTMGFGLPAAIGCMFGSDEPVIAIEGDGSFQMSIEELGTIMQQKLKLKMILFNNERLGMVRELQKMKFDGNYFAVDTSPSPDFGLIAAAYGIKFRKIDKEEELEAAFDELLNADEAFLLEIAVDPLESTL